ncbi:MAG: peptidylprolyl isomerase [Bdellovibrionota bacterium]
MAITIEEGRVVQLSYRIVDQSGRVLDERTPEQPYEYIHGQAQIVPPVERAVKGRTAGYTCEVSVAPRDAYGDYNPGLVIDIPRSNFPATTGVEVGMKFNTTDPEGRTLAVRVIEVGDEVVTVDGNHPLAGLDLIFEVKVLSVREPSPAETVQFQNRPLAPGSSNIH